MPIIFVQETFVNADTNTIFSESEVYQSRYETTRDVYHFCLQEYGKCTGKIRITPSDKPVGWVFQKRDKYSDSKDSYLRDVWVSLYDEAGNPLFLKGD